MGSIFFLCGSISIYIFFLSIGHFSSGEMESLKGKIICIEGNIAVGKTTLIQTMAEEATRQNIGVVVIAEYIDEALLERFNDQPRVYGFAFQEAMMKMRINNMKKSRSASRPENIVLMDTGLLRELAFSSANYAIGHMTWEEYSAHMAKFRAQFEEVKNMKPDLFLIIDCPVDRCMLNIKKRNRANEIKLERTYLEKLRECHKACTEDPLLEGYDKFIIVSIVSEYPKMQDVMNEIHSFYRSNP